MDSITQDTQYKQSVIKFSFKYSVTQAAKEFNISRRTCKKVQKEEAGTRKASSDYSCTAVKLLQSCPTLCDPIDGSPPGSPVPGILQARTLEWVAISFSNA